MVTFDPVVTVKTMSVDIEEHAEEVKNPKNILKVVPDSSAPRKSIESEKSGDPEKSGKSRKISIPIIIIIIIVILAVIVCSRSGKISSSEYSSRDAVDGGPGKTIHERVSARS